MSIPDYTPLHEEVQRRQNEWAARMERHSVMVERFMPAYTGPCDEGCDVPAGWTCPKCLHLNAEAA